MHPSPQQLEDWLAAYQTISQVAIQGVVYYVHPISRQEYQSAIASAGGNKARENEALASSGCLWPQTDFSSGSMLASIPGEVAKEVRRLAGQTPQQAFDLLTKWRGKIGDQHERWDLLILTAFPNLKYEDLDSLLPEQYFRYLAAAEFRTRIQIKTTIAGEYFDPEEYVDLLLCSTDELKLRLDKYENDQKAGPPGSPPMSPVEGMIVPDQALDEQRARARNERIGQLQYETTKKGPYGRG